MLKQLTDKFYHLSTETEALLQRAIAVLREECEPSKDETLRINTALTGLRDAYSQVRAYASEKIETGDMPEENAPIKAYVAIINNKRLITEGILREFLRTYTNNARFTDVLNESQKKSTAAFGCF